MASSEGVPQPKGGEAVVVFTSKLPEEYQVPEDHLVLPSNLARYGLSEVVNRLLSLEKPVPFDFLADGEFLRTSIAEYLEAHKLSSEKVLKLEYVIALSEPEPSEVDQVPDWISGVVGLQTFPSRWFAASCYDGTVRLYDGSQARLTTRLADRSLTALAADASDNGTTCRIAAAAKDGTVRCCAVSLGGGADGKEGLLAAGAVTTLRSEEHRQAMEAVAFSEDGTTIACGGWDHDVVLWNAAASVFPLPDGASAGSKRKAAAAEVTTPKFVLKGHTQVVTCLHFGVRALFPYTLLSSSWDCSVRVWDTVAASCVGHWPVARAVTSFSLCPQLPPQLATAHEDGHVSLWDIRASPHPTVQGAVSLDASAGLPLASAQVPHRRMATQVHWCPQDPTRIASVGHDGKLCVLDPRSPKMPLQCLRVGKPGQHPTKLLCAAWLARDVIAIGGSDGKVVRVLVGQPGVPAVATPEDA